MAAGQKRGAGARALGRAPSLRAPSGGGARPSLDGGGGGGSDRPVLRLALNRGALALELAEPFPVGPIRLTEMVVRIPGLRFPIDLSGGVARFRHRRGELERLAIEARAADLSAWAAPRVRGLLGEGPAEIVIAPLSGEPEGAPIALVALRAGQAALAFDVVIAPGERDVRLVPERARGVGLGAPPQALALEALLAGLGPAAELIGGAVVVRDAVSRVVREVMPAAGARAPAVAGVRFGDGAGGGPGGALGLAASVGAAPPALGDRALSALEAAELAAEGDAAALAGDLDEARRRYLGALERAPRHRELTARVAWIDCVVGDRAEAALATLVEAAPAVDAGLLGAELLTAVGDREGALTALERAAHAEPFGPLSALGWLRAARLSEGPEARLRALDQGVSRAPLLEDLRWARLEARLDVADLRGAMADAEHLEAAARGADARHAVWRRAAEAHLARGYTADARRLFERALRYAPDSPEAALGLGRSLRAAGEGRRGLDLLARARALAERRGLRAHGLDLELARGLAEVAGDLPAAIARAHGIPGDAAEALEARLLEGRWRAELGDAAGASLALGRLRAAAEVQAASLAARGGEAPGRVAAMLLEAAQIEERERGDLLAAQRHLGLALRLAPRHRAIAAEFRRVTAELSRPAPPRELPEAAPEHVEEQPEVEAAPEDVETTAQPEDVEETAGPEDVEETAAPEDVEETAAPAEAGPDDEVMVERLTDRLRADPGDHPTAIALADALARLGRDLDLLALLSARMEEGDDAVREELAPRRRAVLLRLAAQAREAGRASEAELYEMMLDMP